MGDAVEGGIRLFCPSPSGESFVAGSRFGWVGLFHRSRLVGEYNVQPPERRKSSERELQAVTIGSSPDILYCATSVDIMALNCERGEVAWQHRQKRTWGFLPSLPQGAYMANDEEWAITYSSGEMSIFDRKGRSISTGYFEQAPRFLAWSHGTELVYGSDAHSVYSWPRSTLAEDANPVWRGRNYGLALSADGSMLYVRGESRIVCIETRRSAVRFDFEVGPGLPAMAVDLEGGRIAHLAEGRVLLRSACGELLGEVDCAGEYPLGISSVGERLVVGTREGRIFESDWH